MAQVPRVLTPRQVAEMFGVHPATVSAWADEGKLPCFRTPGGQRRFREADVAEFLAVRPVAAGS